MDAQIKGNQLPMGKPMFSPRFNKSIENNEYELVDDIIIENNNPIKISEGVNGGPNFRDSFNRKSCLPLIKELSCFEELPLSNLSKIGSGASGTIFVGSYENDSSEFNQLQVAIKKMPASMFFFLFYLFFFFLIFFYLFFFFSIN